MLSYYTRFLPPGRSMRYVSKSEWAAGPPEWFLTYSLDLRTPQPRLYADSTGRVYRHVKTFPYGGIWNLFLYRSAEARIGRGDRMDLALLGAAGQ